MSLYERQDPRKVYLIEAYNKGLIQYKIGVSIHPEKRLKEHKTSNPSELTLLHSFHSDWPFKIEAALKRRYQHLSIDGEWYDLEPEHVESFYVDCEKKEQMFETLNKYSTL